MRLATPPNGEASPDLNGLAPWSRRPPPYLGGPVERGREREGERERGGLVEAAARDLEGFRGFKGLNNGLKAGKRQARTP